MISQTPATSCQSWNPSRFSLYDAVGNVSVPQKVTTSDVVGSSVISARLSWHSNWAAVGPSPSWRVSLRSRLAMLVPPSRRAPGRAVPFPVWCRTPGRSRPHLHSHLVGGQLLPGYGD